MRTVTAVVETSAPTTPFIRLRGKWLREHGFEIGKPVYVLETPQGLLLSPNPPTKQLPAIESIKAEYARLGIPTERK